MKQYKILITGGAGYIGSMLSTKLIELGQKVTVIDKLNFSKNSIAHLLYNKNFEFIYGDVRNHKLYKKNIKSHDVIIPLAGLVGAKLCEKFKKEAIEVNKQSIKFLIENVRNNQKIIYPTTNSGYGVGKKNKFCDETSELNPISLYGRTKVEAEKIVMEHKNSVSFRLATVFGYSYRMRTDLLVNNLTHTAFKENELKIFEGQFRRNFIHIQDIVKVFVFALNNFSRLKGETYNVGLSTANITKIQLAKKIKIFLPKLKILKIQNMKDPDQRDYFVSNKKIEKKGFKANIELETGIKELLHFYRHNDKIIKNNY
ncbi:NAD(P)-dependent oxidoreductase [bacterium]|nr:NAD(P)-dependent oxidoreductase [bacterium]